MAGMARALPVTPVSHSLQIRLPTACFSWTTKGMYERGCKGLGNGSLLTAISPDGARVAETWMGPNGSVFTLHEADSGKQTATSAEPFGLIWELVFSPDGTRIAGAGEDGMTHLWDTATGKETARCRGHERKVLSVAFRPDGRHIVTASADGTVRQWDSRTGLEVVPPYDRHVGEAREAVYSPDGLWVASTGTDRTVRVWGAANRQDLSILHGHTEHVTQLAFTADGRVVSASQLGLPGYPGDATVRLWQSGSRGACPYFAAIPAMSIRWRIARTDNGSLRGAGTTPCACGTR